MVKRNILILVVSCFVVIWIGRIYSINQVTPISTFFHIGEHVDCGDIELLFVESHLDNPEVFNNRFNVDCDIDTDDEYKLISICIEVTNTSDNDIGWDSIFQFLDYGFESTVWASSINTTLGASINRLNSECLSPGQSQRLWFIAKVQKTCFKETSWNSINDYQFYYVLSTNPSKVAVILEV